MSLEKKIQAIKKGSYAGSSTKNGKMYHELPFGNLTQLSHHRGNTKERIKRIVKGVDVIDKTVLDLGCNVGGISIGMAMAGARKVVGIDYDDQSLNVAKTVLELLRYTGVVEYRNLDINLTTVANLPKFDVILWLSQWMWAIKQHGMEYAKELLFEVSKKCDVLVFESAADDGKGRIKGATQDDIQRWLEENIVHEIIRREPRIKGWMSRDLFFCFKPVSVIEGRKRARTSCILRNTKNTVRKIYKKDFLWMQEREIKAYTRLKSYAWFPNIINSGDGWIEMPYLGRHRRIDYKQYKGQAKSIISALKKSHIRHRDIKHANFLRLGNKISLVDFGWCLFDGEDKKNIPSNPSLLDEQDVGNDEERIKKIFGLEN